MRPSSLPVWASALAAGAAILLIGGGVLLTLAGRQSGPAGMVISTGDVDIGGPFTLTDQNGAVFTDADLMGRPALIYFGYTFCPDVCPLSLQVMGRALAQLPERQRAQVQPVFVTVDPQRDTVERLRQYVTTSGFPENLVALTGAEDQVEAAKAEYRIFAARGEGEGDFYLVDHTSLIYLMDSEGKFVAAFGHAESPDLVAAAVEDVLR